MAVAIVLLSLWVPIAIGLIAFHMADGSLSKMWQCVGWMCVVWLMAWMFQWIFFSERWWQLMSWRGH